MRGGGAGDFARVNLFEQKTFRARVVSDSQSEIEAVLCLTQLQLY
jgi:hypothetical protein